mgnify:CR=1 FL=1
MANNLFISGDINSGKTTIVKKIVKNLELEPAGFMVGREGENLNWSSFYLLPAEVYINNSESEIDKLKEKGLFAKRKNNGKCNIKTDVFDNYGIQLLSNFKNKDTVIMDELGRFELEAEVFKDRVFEIIKSDFPLIAVIKNERNSFLNKVREILKVPPFYVNKDNREEIYYQAKNRVEKILEDR